MAQPKIHLLPILLIVLLAMGEAKNPSNAKCLIKKYKYCYNLVQVCPNSCPDSCTVDCVSCKPICSGAYKTTQESETASDSETPPKSESPPKSEGDFGRDSENSSNSKSPPTSKAPPPPQSGGNFGGDSENSPNSKLPPASKTPPPPKSGGNSGGDSENSPNSKSPPASKTPPPPKSGGDSGGDSENPPNSKSPPASKTPPPSTPSYSPPSSPTTTPTPPSTSTPSSPPLPPSSPSPSPPSTTPSPSPPSSTPSPTPPTSTPSSPSPPTSSTPSPTPPGATPSSPSPTPSTPSPTPPSTLSSPSPPTPSTPSPTPPSTPSSPSPPTPSTPSPTPPSTTPSWPSPPSTPSSPTPSPSTPSGNPPSSSSSPKTARCKNKYYPECYNVEHVCPSSCPGGCEVDCVTCKPVCKCDRPGAVCQDPRFIGGDGITFYFHGKKDRDFCLVSDSNLHINAHFIGRRNENMKRDFTWVQSIAILFDKHQIFIGALKTSTWDDTVDRLALTFDGEPVTLLGTGDARWQSINTPNVSITRVGDTNNVIVEVEGNFIITAKVVPITEEDSRIHNYGITKEDCFAHLDIGFKFYSLSNEVNGVLGQTYKPNYVSRVNIRANMPVMGRDKEFGTSSLFAADCAVARFNGINVFDSEGSLYGLDMPSMSCASGIDGQGVVCKR